MDDMDDDIVLRQLVFCVTWMEETFIGRCSVTESCL